MELWAGKVLEIFFFINIKAHHEFKLIAREES